MKVLVTGAAGFLGRWFAQHHVEQEDEVVGIDDLSNPLSHWPEALRPVNRIVGDAARLFGTSRDSFDLAYHFAAPVGGRMKIDLDPLFNAGSLGLDAAFFRWAVDHVGTAVYPSSSAVYPVRLQTGEEHVALMESDFLPAQYAWGQPDQVYGFTKLAGEFLAWKSAGYGLSTLCIRPFSGYGEDQGLDYPVPAIARRVALRETPLRVWGSGTQSRDFVHVSDVVGATLARLAAGVTGYHVMNIGSGRATEFKSLARMLAALTEDKAYDPEIATDDDKPEGVYARYADTAGMENYYRLRVSLPDGLRRVLGYRQAQP